nr:MAG TPA: hypothetical protein [Caudoviricetes sp.]
MHNRHTTLYYLTGGSRECSIHSAIASFILLF